MIFPQLLPQASEPEAFDISEAFHPKLTVLVGRPAGGGGGVWLERGEIRSMMRSLRFLPDLQWWFRI